MGKKKQQQSLNNIYRYPLPVTIKPLPQVIPHNPISILYFLWEYLFPTEPDQIKCHGRLSAEGFVLVDDEFSVDTLWSMGFFGKGIFSRSEPTWFVRTARRLGLKGGDKITAEDITSSRRQERKKFKQERAKIEQDALAKQRALERGETVGETASTTADVERVFESDKESDNSDKTLNERDAAIVKDGELVQLEYLQLTPTEAVFLSNLGCLDIPGFKCTDELFDHFARLNDRFTEDYVAYHHFRSRGWCVRSGVKFGTDYLLYRRGPPFSHAEFAINVMSTKKDHGQPWWWNTSVGRVVGGVKKTMVFCYVTLPDLTPGMSLNEILSQCSTREVVYKRWVPTRNRD